ncbi:Crp/Fnr family transcriptional regulator [Streptomyces paludis]|uniref:Crp/Fnr family transcriptional regulator n=1 Tax=Streptomyces paludis TaxID=2282738 RepID=A0A345I139_9ACTN|nr:Crp/Fnr family transcriptional regulator [Streptomyces paludis]
MRRLVGESVWAELLALCYQRHHVAGSTLLRQGERGTHVLAVHSGVAKVIRRERNGDLKLLAFRGPGEILGEVAVLDDGMRSASVQTISDCVVGVMGKKDFLQFVTTHDLFPVLVRYALTRLRESDLARSGGDVLGRLAAVLVDLAVSSGNPATEPTNSTESGRSVELDLTRSELAQYLGTSRNTVTAALADLEYAEVRAARKRIVISDLSALRRAAVNLRD